MSDKIRCLIVDDEPVAREVLQNLLSGIELVHVSGLCKNALEAFNHINAEKIDLIFLDINMPEISGLSFAKSINMEIKIIFTTAYREYAVEGFNLRAVDYLLKPISRERLLQAINKYRDETLSMQSPVDTETLLPGPDNVFVRSDRKMIKISFNEVLYIESVGDYIKIYMKDRSVVTRETIASMEAKIPKNDFIRTHRSFIVSLANIDSYTNELVEIGSKQIPISRSYKDEVIGRLSRD